MKTLFLIFVCLLVINGVATAQTPAVDSLTAYAGTYSFDSGSPLNKFVVTVDKNELYGDADSNGANKLLRQTTDDTFKSTSSYGSIITFTRDATKAVTGVTLSVQGTELRATRDKP